MEKITKSPLNWVGNKYKQLPQLFTIFPKNINNFMDLCTGGGDVAINMLPRANKIYANDINTYVIDIMKEFQSKSIEEILKFIDNRIEEFQLSKTNKEGYLNFREKYNNGTYSTPLDLFTLTRFSFNNNMRFNGDRLMNQAFGANRSSFNPVQRKNTISFHNKIQSVNLSNKSFELIDLSIFTPEDFIYIDPPYLISDSFYNTGARTADLRWEQQDDLKLFNYLNSLNTRFAMSNFIHHKGKTNTKLIEWIEDMKLNTYNINSDYTHCVANIKQNNEPTLEVVITNYKND